MEMDLNMEQIIQKFKRNGHNLTRNGLEMVMAFLKRIPNSSRMLDNLVKHVNEIVMNSENESFESSLRFALESIGHSNYKTFESVVNEYNTRTAFSISPYEDSPETFLSKVPRKELFSFEAYDKMARYKTLLKSITEGMRENGFIGILYENFSKAGSMGESHLYLQNETSEVELIFNKDYQPSCIMVAGCIYIARGRQDSNAIYVSELLLPSPLPPPKHCLMRMKLDYICREINSQKKSLEFRREDFERYKVVSERHNRPLLIFGNVVLDQPTLHRIGEIVSKFTKTYGVVVMMAEGGHTDIDVRTWLNPHQVWLVPHLNNEGPRILPKIPLLRRDYQVEVLTNPARLSLNGRELLFANYPLLHHIHAAQLQPTPYSHLPLLQKKCAELLFAQNNIALTFTIFEKQAQYFNINCNSTVFLYDKFCTMFAEKVEQGGELIGTGNFWRDGDFICYDPIASDHVQFSQEPPQTNH